MNICGILLCFVATGLHSVTGTAAPLRLNYSCVLSQDSVTITISEDDALAQFLSVWAVGNIDASKRGNCTVHKESKSITISGCKADKPVDIIIAETKNLSYPNTIDNRYTTYRLECYSGNVSPNASFTVLRNKDVDEDPNVEENEIAGLTLAVEKKSKDTKPIIVGDALVIEIKGPAPLFYKVLSCNASKASDPKNSIELIKNGALIVDEKMETLPNPKGMNTSFTTPNKTKCLTAEIRAFHFVDDYRVRFTCSIQVCGSQCTKRRKRGIDITGLGAKDLQTTLTVHDNFGYPLDKEANGAHAFHHLSWMSTGIILLALSV